MIGFKNINLRKKLVVIQLATAFTAVMICCAFFVANDLKIYKESAVRNKYWLAEILGVNAIPAIEFNDQDAASQMLQQLKNNSSILNAVILDKEGKEFARYTRAGQKAFSFSRPEEFDAKTQTDFGQKFLVSYRITGKEFLGTVMLQAELIAFRDIIFGYLEIAGFILLASLAAAFTISAFLQRSVTTRLLSLVSTTKDVAQTGNYSIRVASDEDDEIGILARAFNNMLDQIEKTKRNLFEANIELENRVEQRTAQLANANKELDSHIHQLKANEEQLKEYKYFFNNSNDLSCIANTRGYFEIVNPSFERTLGYSKNELSENPFVDFVYPEDVPATLHEYEKLKAGATVINFQNRYRKRDGSYLWFDWNASPNPVTGKLYCIARDITERKKAEEQLQAVNKELEAFSYSVSHDLRAPLRAVHGYAQILKEDYGEQLDKEALRITNAVMDNAKKMGQLIDDLLTFSRLGRKELVKNKISMKEMVAVILGELKGETRSNDIIFHVSELPPAQGDSVTLRQVWLNLISNAIKYSKQKDKAIIQIGSEIQGDEIVYHVKDNGAGFDMRYAGKLFGVFQRLHSHEEFEGTGVGLAIVQRIITKHGGRVWAEGKVDEGASFYFTLNKSENDDTGN